MFGARFAVFARRARVLPSRSQATRNLSFLRFHRRRHHCCFNSVVSLELVRVGLNVPLNENRANVYAHVVVVRRHVCRTLCSVRATGARVVHPFLSNS